MLVLSYTLLLFSSVLPIINAHLKQKLGYMYLAMFGIWYLVNIGWHLKRMYEVFKYRIFYKHMRKWIFKYNNVVVQTTFTYKISNGKSKETIRVASLQDLMTESGSP